MKSTAESLSKAVTQCMKLITTMKPTTPTGELFLYFVKKKKKELALLFIFGKLCFKNINLMNKRNTFYIYIFFPPFSFFSLVGPRSGTNSKHVQNSKQIQNNNKQS